jgi:hypothetical protein
MSIDNRTRRPRYLLFFQMHRDRCTMHILLCTCRVCGSGAVLPRKTAPSQERVQTAISVNSQTELNENSMWPAFCGSIPITTGSKKPPGQNDAGPSVFLPVGTIPVFNRDDPLLDIYIETKTLGPSGQVLWSFHWSGRLDLNQRPPEPHSGALPDCATSRFNGYRFYNSFDYCQGKKRARKSGEFRTSWITGSASDAS